MYNKALTAENCQKSCFQVQTPKNDTFIGEKCSTHKRLQKVCIISFSKMYNTYRFVAKLWQPGSGEAGKKLKNRHCQQNQVVLKKPKSTSNFFSIIPIFGQLLATNTGYKLSEYGDDQRYFLFFLTLPNFVGNAYFQLLPGFPTTWLPEFLQKPISVIHF